MGVSVIAEGHACADCTMMIANGDSSGIEDYPAWETAVEAHNATDSGKYHVVMNCSEDCEGYFSTSPCDFCGSHLAGDRHPIAFLGQLS